MTAIISHKHTSLTHRLLALFSITVVLLGSTAHGQTTFAQFSQDNSTEPFTFTNSNGTFQGTTTGNLTFLEAGAPVGPQAATITLSSSAVTPASAAGPFLVQPIDGPTNTLSFTRTSDNANLLTLTFTGNFSGFDGDNSATLSGNTASGNTVVYTSDFLNFSGTTQRSFGLTATLDPDFSQGGNGFLNDLMADLGGSFSSNPAPDITAVPEASTWLSAALAAGALGAFAARRRKAFPS